MPFGRHGARIVNPGANPRLAVPAEAPSIASVLKRSFLQYKSKYTRRGFEATTPSEETMRERFSEGPIWVALESNEIVGTVSAIPNGEALYIRSMAVLPSVRGQGIGRRLMASVEMFGLDHGHTKLILSTTPFLKEAIHLYEGLGFRRTDDGPNNLFGTPLFTMVKTLSFRYRDSEPCNHDLKTHLGS